MNPEVEVRDLIAAMKVNPVEDELKPSTDPFKVLPQIILDKIFKQFNAETILTASLVCRGWYETIGKSIICMNKINLRVYKPSKNDVSIMLKSKRNYIRIMLACYFNFHRRFLKRFPDVNHLRFAYDVENWDIELPKLNSVLLAGHKLCKNGILSKATHITEFEWIIQDQLDKDFMGIMIDFLKKASNLKVLLFEDKNYDNVFMKLIEHEYTSFKFKLESFTYTLKPSITPEDEIILIRFLKSQADSLTAIYYDSPVPNSVLVSLLQDFPKLTTLGLNTMWLDAPTLPRIRPNPNIKTCQIFRPMPLKMKFLMPLMPNLEHLHVDKIRKNIDGVNMLELIMTLAPKSLKTIGYVTGNHADIQEYFDAMKSAIEAFDDNYDYDGLQLAVVRDLDFLKSRCFNYETAPREPLPY